MNIHISERTTRSLQYLCVVLLMGAVGALGYFFLWPVFGPMAPSVGNVTVCDAQDPACHKTGFPYQDPSLSSDMRVADLLQRMTLDEKIGQMALIEKNSIIAPNDVASYGLGGMVSGAGGKPATNTTEGWLGMVNAFQASARTSRLGIPLLYGVDANHGNGNVFGATTFPHFIGLGASRDAALVREVAKATAEELAAAGINWVYSPDLDVVQDTRWGRTYETFGSDPSLVSLLGQAYIEGTQSFEHDGSKIAATAKHYIGNGATDWDSSSNRDFHLDQGNSTLSEDELRKTQLPPFKAAVDAQVMSIMVGLDRWNGEKIARSSYLLNDVLRKELNFQGLIVSDWYGVYDKEWSQYQALVRSINAGVDMVMLPFDYQVFSENVRQAVASGDVSRGRIDEAVRRILKVKFDIGAFDAKLNGRADMRSVGSQAHRDLARKAVSESLVLLKGGDAVLPLSKNTPKVLVAGSAADNIGKQSGGWTIEWQGVDGNWIPGTSILKGIQETVATNTQVAYDRSGSFADQKGLADIGIAVVGESPYAEGIGDNAHPKLSAEDLSSISTLKKKSKKLIVILISGRPLDIKAYAKDWDVVIAAWLPGSEGQGVSDVLFGSRPFTGTLPVPWAL